MFHEELEHLLNEQFPNICAKFLDFMLRSVNDSEFGSLQELYDGYTLWK